MNHNPNTYTSRERMSQTQSSSLFCKPTESILQDGLRAATAACEALTEQNRILNSNIDELKGKVRILEDRAMQNLEDKE